MTITRARITLLLILAVALFATSGCLFSPPEKHDDDDDTVEFGPYATPDELVDNFLVAWEHMVLEEYRDQILYDGEEPIVGGANCEQFKFYFIIDSFDDPFWGYDLEVEHTDALFSGNPGLDETPGVESISLHLTQMSSWSTINEGAPVMGDAAPAGTKFKPFRTNMTINLKGTMPDGTTNAFLVDDVIQFYVVPADVDGSTEYRLWKWIDVSNE